MLTTSTKCNAMGVSVSFHPTVRLRYEAGIAKVSSVIPG